MMLHNFCPMLCLLVMGQVFVGCGLTSSTEPDYGKEASEQPLCSEGELRMSEEVCANNSYKLEECQAESWTLLDNACFESKVCQEGDTGKDEFVGEYFFNEQLVECRDGVLQILGASCGAVTPKQGTPWEFGPVDEHGRVEGLDGVSFPIALGFGPGGTSTELNQVLCVDTIWTEGDYPQLPNLFGARTLRINGPDQMKQFGSLRKLGILVIESTSGADIRALGPIEQLQKLQMQNTSLLSLAGLERVQEMDAIELYGNTLLEDLRGLAALRVVKNGFIVTEAKGSAGLEGLQSVGGDLVLPITDASELEDLSQLRTVGGDLTLHLASVVLSCAATEFVSTIDIGGAVQFLYAKGHSPECTPDN